MLLLLPAGLSMPSEALAWQSVVPPRWPPSPSRHLFLVFPLLGGTYDAAVIAAGFSGFTLGSTPTAMANMTAVTQKFGPSPKAFIVLPLVSAFFIGLLNAVLIPFFLHRI